MSDAATDQSSNTPDASMPDVSVPRPVSRVDYATILGLIFSILLIIAAIAIGQSKANFFNIPSFMIVILGTMAATSVSFTGGELANAGKTMMQSMRVKAQQPKRLARALMDLAVASKKKGVLGLSKYDGELSKDKFLSRSVQMVVDGYLPKDVDFLILKEIDSLVERHKRSAQIAHRASEVAPAMGLIGTLVGLVQMLAELENPEAIGPAMAVALLTTFYGAIMGTVVMAPLAVKLEKRSSDEALSMNLIRLACVSIAGQDNPRKLEMQLNSELPPQERIRYFD